MNPRRVISLVLNSFTNDSRVLMECLSLRKAGYEVGIVALHEANLTEWEQVNELWVHRVKLKSRGWSKRKIVQILKYVELIIRVVRRYRNQADIVHCNDLNALPIGVFIKLFSMSSVKIVYDAHEYETEINGSRGIGRQFSRFIERFFIRYADQVITVSDSIAVEYSKNYSIPKPHLVLNCPPYRSIKPSDLLRENLGIAQNQVIFLYQGGLGRARGIEILLEAFASFKNDRNVLVCMGYGPLEQMVQGYAKIYNTIFFHPAVSSQVLLNYTASGDYGILFYENTCLNHFYCSPNKMFEYLMADLPVLTSNLYEMKRLVKTHQLGIVARENTVQGFVEAVEESLALDYRQIKANVEAVKKTYCWEEQEKVLYEVYHGL